MSQTPWGQAPWDGAYRSPPAPPYGSPQRMAAFQQALFPGRMAAPVPWGQQPDSPVLTGYGVAMPNYGSAERLMMFRRDVIEPLRPVYHIHQHGKSFWF